MGQSEGRAGARLETRQMQERLQLQMSALNSCWLSATAGLKSSPGNATLPIKRSGQLGVSVAVSWSQAQLQILSPENLNAVHHNVHTEIFSSVLLFTSNCSVM